MTLLKRLHNLWRLSGFVDAVSEPKTITELDDVFYEKPRPAQIVKMKLVVKEFLDKNKTNE